MTWISDTFIIILDQVLQIKKKDERISHINLTDIFINQKNNHALIEILIIDSGLSKGYFIEILKNEPTITIILFPLTDSIKKDCANNYSLGLFIK